jgi:2-C-methyl-D-erythritol 4-phosphate cytidylyltransferase
MVTGSVARQAPKQFLELHGQPILVLTVRAFLQVPSIHRIFVAVRKSELQRVESQLAEHGLLDKVSVVEGGDTRQDSVRNAMKVLPAADEDIVLVHDAVRPLIDAATIERTIESVEIHHAAIVAVPAVDTIKQVERTADGAIITSTIPRERIVLAQTPQGFRFRLLRQSIEAAELDGFVGTDEASLVERLGIEVAVVLGSPRNFKITQPGDLALAEFYLSQS